MKSLRSKSARYITRLICGVLTAFCLMPAYSQPNDLVKIYRFSGPNLHFYTSSYPEGNQANYGYVGVAFSAHPIQLDSNMLQAYRCRGSTHFISTSTNCEGVANEGALGWISNIPRDEFIPLYRFIGGAGHLVTTNYSEGSATGYQFEGTIGYVHRAATKNQVPIASFRTNYAGVPPRTDYTDDWGIVNVPSSTSHNLAFMLFSFQQDSNMGRLYKCGLGFLSSDPACEGQTLVKALGWLSTIPRQGYTPLYRFVNSANDHVSTIDYADPNVAGYSFEGILGYVSIDQKPMFRFYQPPLQVQGRIDTSLTDHLLTTTFRENINRTLPADANPDSYWRYKFEGVGFNVFNSQQDSSMHLLYRCLVGSDHFVSLRSDCEGRNFEAVYGWVASNSRPGWVPVHRFFNDIEHLTTTNYTEGVRSGYRYEGILGYVPL